MDPFLIAPFNATIPPNFITSPVISAATHQIIFYGRPTWRGASTTKDLRRLALSLGAVTAGTATIRFSVQDPDLGTGPAGRADATVDENYTVATTSLTANAVFETGDLSADRTITRGAPLMIVIDFSSWTSTASVVARLLQIAKQNGSPACTLYNGATYTNLSGLPLLGLIFSDGTRGTFAGTGLVVATSNVDFNNATALSASLDSGDERGNLWVPDAAGELTGVSAEYRYAGGTSDHELCVYRDTTLLATVTVDANVTPASGSTIFWDFVFSAPISFSASDNLYFVLKPTTANNVRLPALDFAHADDLLAAFGGVISWAQREDGGAWATNTGHTTRMAPIYPRGRYSSAGGGLLTHPGMAGGMRA